MKLCVFGSEGRMGRLIRQEAGDSVVACYDLVPPGTPPDVPLPDDVEVVLDFSLPSAWKDLDRLLKGSSAALVTGTTGLGTEHREMLGAWALERAVFAAANMSVGIHVLGRLLDLAAKESVAMMCSEGDHRKCHRTMLITPALLEAGARVWHIQPGGTTVEAEPEPKQLSLL